jgi:hypothetical protein
VAASTFPFRTASALGALGALCLLYLGLAALPAARGSRLIPATAGGSPDWLLGPLRPLGVGAAAGALAGPVFFAGLLLALVTYVLVVARARAVPARAAAAAVVGLHALFLLAPPLLSQDVFSYLAYARLEVLHGIDPYAAGPLAAPGDPIFPFAGSKGVPSVYGPAFTLLSEPLAHLSVPAAFWVLKAVAALSSLVAVGLVWRAAERRGGDPVAAALLIGLNPALLVHVVAGAHNDALVMALTAGALSAFTAGRTSVSAALGAAAGAIKASAPIVIPFLVAGSRRAVPALGAAATVALIAAALGLTAFSTHALAWIATAWANQAHGSSLSLPSVIATLLALPFPGERAALLLAVRLVLGAGLAVLLTSLVMRTRRGTDAIAMAGWATIALLLTTAWLVPWYMAWLLPLAAVADDARLRVATALLSAWLLAIAIPF